MELPAGHWSFPEPNGNYKSTYARVYWLISSSVAKLRIPDPREEGSADEPTRPVCPGIVLDGAISRVPMVRTAVRTLFSLFLFNQSRHFRQRPKASTKGEANSEALSSSHHLGLKMTRR